MVLSRRERRDQRKSSLREKRIQQIQEVDKQESFVKKTEYKGFLKFYDKQYKKLLFIPFILLFLAFISIGLHIVNTGDFINRGVSLSGGIIISVPVQEPVIIDELNAFLKERLPDIDFDVRSIAEFGEQKAIIISTNNLDSEDAILSVIDEKIPNGRENASTESTGSSLGSDFFKQIVIALIIAFIFMGLVVFIYFRTLVPSLAAILSVFSDIVVTLAVVNIIGIKLSTAGIAAFLMLIGYSIDTDILLSTRVLKRKEGTVFDRILSAAKTGLTMNITTLVAITVALIFTQSVVIKQIMLILLIGLFVDIMNTWLQNTGLLRYYVENIKVK